MRSFWIVLGLALTLVAHAAGARKPAVLFTSGLHRDYFAVPLHDEGIELHTCTLAELPARLQSGKYNVVYVTGGFDQPAVVAALQAFMAAGGGVLVCYTHPWDQERNWEACQQFLTGYGAHFAWVELRERDPARITPSSYHLTLVQTDQIAEPFNRGVSSLLYFHLMHVAGAPPTPLVTDASWTPVVRGSATSVAVPYTEEKQALKRKYLPPAPLPSPTFLAVRGAGAGRLAAFGLAPEWVFASPGNCPPVKEMMTAGAGPYRSHWVRVLANTFRWLAEPTLAADKGGEPTPPALLTPVKVTIPTPPATRDWTKAPPITDQEQLPGLVGAQSPYSGGIGTVAEWVAAAKAAGLKFLVFLEPLDRISREDYAKLQRDCAAATDDTFFACPGLRYQDVYTKTHCFAYGEKVEYPRANLLTPDGKYLNNADKKLYRSRHLFDYVLEQNNYQGQYGYFRHAANPTPPWEYKLYSLFTIYSTEHGQPVDNHFDDYAYLQASRMQLTPLSISLMTQPSEIATAVTRDWLVVNTAPGEFGDGSYSEEYGAGIPAMRKLFTQLIAWFRPFQYITQGPRILCWRDRWPVSATWRSFPGEWFRPDQDRYRVRLHVTSDVGLKEIRIMSMGQVLQRYLPAGAKDFDRTLEFENIQQRDLYPVIEDISGKKAIGMICRNTTTRWTEFICGDRCNYLNYGMDLAPDYTNVQFKAGGGNSVTHNKGNWRLVSITPADTLTSHSATLPTDGAPIGGKCTAFNIAPQVDTPGFPLPSAMNCRPRPLLAGPDVFIGGGTLNMLETDPTSGEGAWEFFGPVKENDWIEGGGMHTSFHPTIDGLRAGWYELTVKTRKAMPLGRAKLGVQFTWLPFTELRDGNGNIYAAGATNIPNVGSFASGAYVLLKDDGGELAVYSMDDTLRYEYVGNNQIRIGLQCQDATLPAGTELHMKLGYLGGAQGRSLEDLRRYLTAMRAPLPAVKLTRGTLTRMDGIAMHVDIARTAAVMTVSPLKLYARLPLVLEHAQPNWDVWLLNAAQAQPNWRQLPKVGATAYASLPGDEQQQLFLGHPVTADRDDVCIALCNLLPGQWLVSLHNPTDRAITTTVRSTPGWTAFRLPARRYTLPAGSSIDIPVTGRTAQ
jgi:hypothetical protein